jgi:CRP/FNR family cyclic AMP-dependent transcriptional regulator
VFVLLAAAGGNIVRMVTEQTEEANTFPLLRQTGLRRFLSETQLKQLEHFCRSSIRKPGATIFRQGEPAETIYMVVEGSIELRARPPGRRVYRTVEVIQPTCTFGDEAVFDESAYLSSARVLETARLLILSRASFARLSGLHPDIATGILRCSGSCLLQTIRRSAILTQSPADVGLRHLLLELAGVDDSTNGRSGTLRITHAQLAGVLHLSRETVSRMLANMASEGSVDLGRGVIRVHKR